MRRNVQATIVAKTKAGASVARSLPGRQLTLGAASGISISKSRRSYPQLAQVNHSGGAVLQPHNGKFWGFVNENHDFSKIRHSAANQIKTAKSNFQKAHTR